MGLTLPFKCGKPVVVSDRNVEVQRLAHADDETHELW
jgi:hypothetical protein